MGSLRDHRKALFLAYAIAERLDIGLRGPRNHTPIFFAARVKDDPDLKDSYVALLRLGEDLERRFGVHGEIAVYFVPWRDLQRRSFNGIAQRTTDIFRSVQHGTIDSKRYTPSRKVALLVSPDPHLRAKVAEWQEDSIGEMTIVPLILSDEPKEPVREVVAASLRENLGERDLYSTQNPVTGADFFGRTKLIRALTAAVRGDQNVAVLGLRRSGKTSALRELRRVLLPKGVIVPIGDFQMLDEGSVEELASSIASSLNDELKAARSEGIEVWIGNESDQSTADFSARALSDRIKRVAARNPHLRIAIAVDEIETAAAIAVKNPDAIKSLLGALRSAAQSSSNVSLLFSGVANTMFRNSTLGAERNVDNPMFSQVVSHYLSAFSLEETATLLRGLGSPMLLDWSDPAISEVHRLTGGFPYLVRDLASNVRREVRTCARGEDVDTLEVSSSHVAAAARHWAADAAHAWGEIVAALGMHYEAAALLLDNTLSNADLSDWIASDAEMRTAAGDLIELGLLELDGDSHKKSEMLSALQALASSHGQPQATARSAPAQQRVEAAIRSGESHRVEFKQSCRVNVHTREKDPRMEDAVTKTVAGFLNSEGGTLLIGVADDGAVKGIGLDLALFKKGEDGLERWLRDNLLAHRIDRYLVTEHVDVEFVTWKGKTLIEVQVTKSETPAWVNDEKLYRRIGGQTIELKGRDLQDFIIKR